MDKGFRPVARERKVDFDRDLVVYRERKKENSPVVRNTYGVGNTLIENSDLRSRSSVVSQSVPNGSIKSEKTLIHSPLPDPLCPGKIQLVAQSGR